MSSLSFQARHRFFNRQIFGEDVEPTDKEITQNFQRLEWEASTLQIAVEVQSTDVNADCKEQYASSNEEKPLQIRDGGGRDTFEVYVPTGNALGFSMTIFGGTGLLVLEDLTMSDIQVGDIVTQLNGLDIDF